MSKGKKRPWKGQQQGTKKKRKAKKTIDLESPSLLEEELKKV